MNTIFNASTRDYFKQYKNFHLICHSDLDGVTAGASVLNALKLMDVPNESIYVEYTNYKDMFPVKENFDCVFLIDLAIANDENAEKVLDYYRSGKGLFWFDHHASSIEMEEKYPELKNIQGIRSTKGCGAILTYIFYDVMSEGLVQENFSLFNYINRMIEGKYRVEEYVLNAPRFIRLVDDHDRGIHNIPGSTYLNEAYYSLPSFPSYSKNQRLMYLCMKDTEDKYLPALDKYISAGLEIYHWKLINGLSTLKLGGFEASICDDADGNPINMICLNTPLRGSTTFGPLYGSEYEVAMCFHTKGETTCATIYTNSSRVSAKYIAEKFGGGGHPNCAGFTTTSQIPFKNVRNISKDVRIKIDSAIQDVFNKLKREMEE